MTRRDMTRQDPSLDEAIERTVAEAVNAAVKSALRAEFTSRDPEVQKLRAHVRDLRARNARLLKENHRVRESRRRMIEDLMNDPRFGAGR